MKKIFILSLISLITLNEESFAKKKETIKQNNKIDDCPFETKKECKIWNSKPIILENIQKQKNISKEDINQIIDSINKNKTINLSTKKNKAFVEKYQEIMNFAQICCTEKIIYELKKLNLTSVEIYNFIQEDINSYNFNERCMVSADETIYKLLEKDTADIIIKAKGICLCNNKNWILNNLKPFKKIMDKAPNFRNTKMLLEFKDGLNRKRTVSMNEDIVNIFESMQYCK